MSKIQPKPEKIQKLIDLVLLAAHKRREDAGYSDLRHDNGARELEKQVEFFNYGWNAATLPELNMADNMPESWKEFEVQLDPEYAQYQKLKKKFEKR